MTPAPAAFVPSRAQRIRCPEIDSVPVIVMWAACNSGVGPEIDSVPVIVVWAACNSGVGPEIDSVPVIVVWAACNSGVGPEIDSGVLPHRRERSPSSRPRWPRRGSSARSSSTSSTGRHNRYAKIAVALLLDGARNSGVGCL